MIVHLLNFFDHFALLTILFWTVFGFLLGSIPFAKLFTRWFAGKDITQIGDGNPGAYNAWIAGGWPVGAASVLTDVGKGLLPVLLAQQIGSLGGWQMLPVVLAPALGHAFSPFRQFKQAKAVATTLGAWFGLTGLPGIISFALCVFLASAFTEEHAWTVMAGMFGLVLYSLIFAAAPWMVAAAALNMLLLAYTHRADLRQPVYLHNRVGELLLRRRNIL
jgi:acyl phosphate:glycerol-3-phosphate acyltransferase